MSDELIWHMVQNQELLHRVYDTFSYDDLDNTAIRGELITSITTRSLFKDLDDLFVSVPPNLQGNSMHSLKSSIAHQNLRYDTDKF